MNLYPQALAWHQAIWVLKAYLWNENETYYSFNCAFDPKLYGWTTELVKVNADMYYVVKPAMAACVLN